MARAIVEGRPWNEEDLEEEWTYLEAYRAIMVKKMIGESQCKEGN